MDALIQISRPMLDICLEISINSAVHLYTYKLTYRVFKVITYIIRYFAYKVKFSIAIGPISGYGLIHKAYPI